MALPILLDCDPGHDDAIAIVLALASPELDVKAITSSAGNQTPEKTLRNVLRMLTLLNRTDIPVAGGAVKPLMRELIIDVRTAKLYGGRADGENAARKCGTCHDCVYRTAN